MDFITNIYNLLEKNKNEECIQLLDFDSLYNFVNDRKIENPDFHFVYKENNLETEDNECIIDDPTVVLDQTNASLEDYVDLWYLNYHEIFAKIYHNILKISVDMGYKFLSFVEFMNYIENITIIYVSTKDGLKLKNEINE